ncbi:MAG: hypothetical protein GY854_32755 [Deltaproteobacteria bacterium]|nr:hypothetical protein [Deltaproteobacteria bacterium]
MDKYVAWALHTGPKQPTPLWEDSRWITGEWDGKEDPKEDIDARVDCLIQSFKTARESVSEQSTFGLNYFVIPEFYFHYKRGPYPEIEINGELPFGYICSSLERKIKEMSLESRGGQTEDWVICAGSALTCSLSDIEHFLGNKETVRDRLRLLNEQIKELRPYKVRRKIRAKSYMKRVKHYMQKKHNKNAAESPAAAQAAIDEMMAGFRADPLCVVRNRGVLLKATFGGSETDVHHWTYEKQYEATCDLTMGKILNGKLEHEGMITEWMAGYPSISIIRGDKNTKETPIGARITIDGDPVSDKKLELGVEICLDHRLARLRRTVGMRVVTGAAADNPALDVQLITSGGMQILDSSVAAEIGGVIFNCDGCDPILDQYFDYGKQVIPGSGTFTQLTCGVYASSAQTMRKGADENEYFSHSQLAFRYGNKKADKLDGYNNALGVLNKKGQTYNPVSGRNKDLDAYREPDRIELSGGGDSLFAAGLGELHVYPGAA